MGGFALEGKKFAFLSNNLFVDFENFTAGGFNAVNPTLNLLELSFSWASQKIKLYVCIKSRQCPAPA